MFYNRITTVKLVEEDKDYRIMNKIMLDSILDLTEHNNFSKDIWIGFRTKRLEYDNIELSEGKSSWYF